MSGGSLFYSQQFPCDDDEEMFATLIYPAAITADEEGDLKAEMTSRFGIQPDVTNTLLFDGSSTTAGNGTDTIDTTSQMTSDLVQGVFPNRSMTLAVSLLPEGETFLLPAILKIKTAAVGSNTNAPNVIVYHPGLGNAIQAGGSVPISHTNGAQLTLAENPANLSFFPGFHVTGVGAADASVIPPGTQIVAADSAWYGKTAPFTVTLSNAPTAPVSTLSLANDTGAEAWASNQSYISEATSAGFKVVLIGSASRWFFESSNPLAPTWLQEFHNAKALMANGWKAAGAVAYIDLETDPIFGADPVPGGGTTMTVTSVNPSSMQVIVAKPSQYLAVGNYVSWPGMSAPAAFITAIAGNTLTLSQTPPASLVSTGIGDFDPVPWQHHSSYWNLDGQHFTYAGYQEISKLTAQVLTSGLLP